MPRFRALLWVLILGVALPQPNVAAEPSRKAGAQPAPAQTRCRWKDGNWPHKGGILGPRDNPDPSPPPELPVDLVVVGKANRPRTDGQEGCEVRIERILFGSPPSRPLVDDTCEDSPQLMRWAPLVYGDGYERRDWYHRDPTQAPAERAYRTALLDCEVLSSTRIFVAKEVKAEGNRMHTVEVVRSLHGPPLRPGQRISIKMVRGDYGLRHSETLRDLPRSIFEDPIRSNAFPSLQANPFGLPFAPSEPRFPVVRHRNWIFLSSGPADVGDQGPEPRRPGTVLLVERRFSTGMEPAIRAALSRRSRYPVARDSEGRSATNIIFLGSTDESIRLLGSSLPEAVALAASTLNSRRTSVEAQVLKAIERDMGRVEPTKGDDFTQLRNLINLLHDWDRGNVDRHAGRLLRKLMAQIPSLPQGPARPRLDVGARNEAELSTANHAIAWLLMTMPYEDRLKLAPDLMGLRERVQGHWRSEIDLAIAATSLETAVALATARGKITTLRRIPSSRPCGQDVEAINFAPDGQRLLTLGRDGHACAWDLASLQPASTTALPRGCKLLSIRPDGRYLLCFDAQMRDLQEHSQRGDGVIRVSVVDARDDMVVSRLDLPMDPRTNRIRWLDNYQAMLATYNQILTFDYLAGRSSPPLDIKAYGVLSEDGRAVYDIHFMGKMTGWPVLEVVDTSTGQGRKLEKPTVHVDTDSLSGLVPSTPYLYITSPMLKLLDRQTLEPAAAWDTDGEVEGIAFSPDGSLCALAIAPCAPSDVPLWLLSDQKKLQLGCSSGIRLSVHETTSGKRRALLQVPEGWAKEMVFSPRLDRLALRAKDGVVRLWELPRQP